MKQRAEEEDRIKEENRRLKEWEDKFDQEQKKREEELIRKFYSDHPGNINQEKKIDNEEDNSKDENKNN